MNDNQISMDWEFWRRYVLFSTLGYGIGGAVSWLMIIFGGWLIPINIFVLIVLSGSVVGTAVGLTQWQAIRLKSSQVNKLIWMAGNVVGLAIIWTLLYWVMITTPLILPMTIMIGALWGFLSAAIQWYALRRQIRHTVIWFTLSTLAGVVVLIVGWSSLIIVSTSIIWSFASWPIAGLLYGVMTGTVLTWLLRGSNQSDESNEYVLAG